jgi:hypothetical protein
MYVKFVASPEITSELRLYSRGPRAFLCLAQRKSYAATCPS